MVMNKKYVGATPPCRTRRLAVAGLLGLGLAAPLLAQESWPSKPIKIIVPNPPGGGVDVFARALAEQLAQMLGQTVLVDNKPGAGGLLAIRAVAPEHDGHTLLYVNSGMVTLQAMTGRFDLLNDLRPVARLAHSPMAVVVKSDSPFKTFGELMKAVKAQPNKLSYGSGGLGSPPHLAMALLDQQLGGFDALHAPYKGAVSTMTAVAGGEIDFAIGLVAPMTPLAQAGRVRPLAMTSRQRVPLLPNVPTIAESGVPGFALEPWGGLAAGGGAPDAVLKRLNELLPKAMASTQVREAGARLALVPDYLAAKEFRAQITRDLEVEKPLVKKLDLKPE